MNDWIDRGWAVRVLSDREEDGMVSVLAPIGETSDSLGNDYPSDEEVARLAGVARVKFLDAGDHQDRVESLYRIVEV